MSTIVVGFDGSPAAERALERVAALGGEGRVVVVTATVAVPPANVIDEPLAAGPSPGERGELLERAAATLRARGIEPELVAADAQPAEALVQAARANDAGLIVVGGTGSDFERRALIGSTTEHVVRQAPCDVLVVR